VLHGFDATVEHVRSGRADVTVAKFVERRVTCGLMLGGGEDGGIRVIGYLDCEILWIFQVANGARFHVRLYGVKYCIYGHAN
jgi:hypothetical protein